ncbi:MAG: glycosyltransferase family 4 protein [Candidatus Yanofskybacteria bacterium]|nr:glycosyltransferase family 4 protein [Candidatus Yanofskybacteria bacterium]
MRVLYFGAYNALDQRNAIIMAGLRRQEIEIIECQDTSPGIGKFLKLFKKHWKLRKQYDLIFVGFLSHILMPLVVFINSPFISGRSRKPVILDGYMSLYDSNVFGRQKYNPKSLKAGYYYAIDWIAFHLADLVLFDTQEHIKYISREFGVKPQKMARLFVGARENIFQPQPYEPHDKFRIFFHGSFIRSQGIEFILEAAKKLESYPDIEFLFIGDGQVKEEMVRYAEKLAVNNVTFLGRMPPQELTNYIASADVCLGLFGKADKIQRVIATKVFEYAAMGRPIITGEAPAVRELLGQDDIYFVTIADPDDLAKAILKLKDNPSLRTQLAENCYRKYVQYASTREIGQELKNLMLRLHKNL